MSKLVSYERGHFRNNSSISICSILELSWPVSTLHPGTEVVGHLQLRKEDRLEYCVMSLQSSVTSKQRKGYKTEDKGNKSENELGSYVSCSVTLKSWLCLSDNTEEHSILFQHLRSYNWVKQRNDISHWLLPSWYWYCPIKNDDISLIQRIFIFKIARLCKSKSYYQYVLSQDVLYIN